MIILPRDGILSLGKLILDVFSSGSTAAKTRLNQPGSACWRMAAIRLKGPLVAAIGQELPLQGLRLIDGLGIVEFHAPLTTSDPAPILQVADFVTRRVNDSWEPPTGLRCTW